ncbi:MAG: hypothetical protein HGA45_42530 [Chloroflexales bacterium]|nr:hypothetical protein [Chloroflexales bacterium]
MALSDPQYAGLPTKLFEAIYRAGIRAGQELMTNGEPDMANLGDFELNSLVDDLAVAVLGVKWPLRDSDRYEAGFPADELKREAAGEWFTLSLAANPNDTVLGDPTA